MNNLYQYFSELTSLTSDEQKKYLATNVTDEYIRQALESMLSQQAFDFTALFSDGMLLSNDLVNGDNFIGQNIGKYEITSLIGQGGMGCVFLAKRIDGEFEQEVAIKVILNVSITVVDFRVVKFATRVAISVIITFAIRIDITVTI